MKKIVLRFGLASGIVLAAASAVLMPLCMSGKIQFENSETLGYTSMVLAFLMVFFGIRSYREKMAGGAITFGKAFQVGILITLVTCSIYVIAWEIAYFNFFPDFLDKYAAVSLEKMQARGESAEAIQKAKSQMEFMAKHYDNVFFNSAITFMEIFPVGLIVTLVSAAILRKRNLPGAPATPVPA